MHATPHAPQLAGSLSVSRHVPLQFCCPGGQATTQLPSRHTWPAVQAVPHPPQLLASMRVSAHARLVPEPQRVSGAAHSRPHVPPEQTLPVGQRVPHMPQFSRSVAVETQRPEHAVCPGGQARRQVPAAHDWPEGQTLPQPPQLELSFWMSRHVPPQLV